MNCIWRAPFALFQRIDDAGSSPVRSRALGLDIVAVLFGSRSTARWSPGQRGCTVSPDLTIEGIHPVPWRANVDLESTTRVEQADPTGFGSESGLGVRDRANVEKPRSAPTNR